MLSMYSQEYTRPYKTLQKVIESENFQTVRELLPTKVSRCRC